jgi:hypothetical protein
LHGRWRKTVQMQSRLACECSLPRISFFETIYSHNVPSVHARLLITSHRGGRLEVSLVHRVVLRYFVRLLILTILSLSVDLLGLPQACQWRTPVHRWSLQQGLDVRGFGWLALEITVRATNQICQCCLRGLEDYPFAGIIGHGAPGAKNALNAGHTDLAWRTWFRNASLSLTGDRPKSTMK